MTVGAAEEIEKEKRGMTDDTTKLSDEKLLEGLIEAVTAMAVGSSSEENLESRIAADRAEVIKRLREARELKEQMQRFLEASKRIMDLSR